MSLINDALKRAKDAQKNDPAPSGPQLRPAEPVPRVRRGVGLMLPFIFAVIALVGLLFAWELWKINPTNQQPVETKPVVASIPTVTASNSSVPQKSVKPAPIPAAQPTENVKPIAPPAPVVAASPSLPPLKLQAVFFNPGRSSVMVDGKTVVVGDTIAGFRVSAIGPDSATLIKGTQTNRLTLNK